MTLNKAIRLLKKQTEGSESVIQELPTMKQKRCARAFYRRKEVATRKTQVA